MTETPLALVTGASRGIGYELARILVAEGHDLLLNAEDEAVETAAAELRASGRTVGTVRADLATSDGVEEVHRAVIAAGRPLDVAVLNAGVGHGGAFVDSDLADELRVVDLDVRSVVHLAHRLLPPMVARGAGRMLVTSSIAATMPGSNQAIYNASKSFVQSFTEAVADELSGTGVTLTSLMPGPTATDFFRRAGMLDTLMGQAAREDPAQVARQGYDALMAGRTKVVGGSLLTKTQAMTAAVLPDQVKAVVHRLIARPGSGA
jgi:short-subunit dehydrogenase